MTTPITITIRGQTYTHNASPAEEAALAIEHSAQMGKLPVGPDQPSDTPASERPGYLATPADYLRWAIDHVYTDGMDVAAVMATALASYAGTPPQPSPEVPLSAEAEKARLIAYAEAKQLAVKQGGTVINGVPVSTTKDGRIDLVGAVSLAHLAPEHTFDWDTDAGVIQLTGPQILAIGVAVGLWVQATYTTLGVVRAGIANGSITSTTQIDEAFA